jgi:acetyl-CoA carboxylase carboxyltransferase component
MPILTSNIDKRADEFRSNRSAMLEKLAEFEELMEASRQGGGPKYIERHRKRGKLLARERLELLLDRDTPFLELSSLAGWGSDFPLGGNAVTGVGVVSGVEVAISAHDPTSRAGSSNPISLAKTLRLQDIARQNRLPLINVGLRSPGEGAGQGLPRRAAAREDGHRRGIHR